MGRRRVDAAILAFSAVLPALAAGAPEPPAFRLPDTARPLRYLIELTVVPGKDTFRGLAEIQLAVNKPADVLWLNATDLNIEQATLRSGSSDLKARIIS